MSGRNRQLKAIVFSDVVDSSVKIFADELIAIQRIKEDLSLIREELQAHGGLLVKSLGDGLLATFDGPTQALDFIQSAVQKLLARGRQSLSHRFGLHTGEIYADGDDIIGQGVHLASRLQTVSPPNGVAFVRSTYDVIDPRYKRLAMSIGEVQLKGLPEAMQAFALGPEQLLQFGRFDHSEELDLDRLLEGSPFALLRPMGRASMRQTFLVQERQRDRQAVMKLIPAGPALAEALQVEAACLDRLRHPRIPRVVDVFANSGLFCFVQEYIPGPSLQGSMDLLRRKQRLAELLRQVLQVLERVHAAGLVHGDLHPANLIPAQDGGELFLVDFSLLKSRVSSGSDGVDGPESGDSVLGRPYFTAPERVRFGRLTPSADLYALGVTALSLYTGQDPAELYDQSQGCWSLHALEPEVAGWLAPLLEELPGRRLQQASDALRLLDQPHPLHVSPSVASAPSPSVGLSHGVSKQVLQTRLVSTYGPMVEMLLDSQPTLIPVETLRSLEDRLVTAGLALVDVQEACHQALVEPKEQSSGAPPSEEMLVTSAGLRGTDSTGSAGLAMEVLPVLRLVIGPIADVLWTDAMDAVLAADPAELLPCLLHAGVPQTAARQVVEQCSLQLASPSVDAQAPAPAPRSSEQEPAAVDGEQLLLRLIGPIGSTVWHEVAHLPAEQRLAALESTLRGYGLDALTLADLRRQLQGG
jgi:serine/threonine protein kinase/class 3 adenylate cyclase